MEWQQFVMNLDTLNPASVEEILVRHGAQSVTFSDAGDVPVLEPGPGETPLWNNTRITGLFDPGVDMAAVLADLRSSLALDQLPDHRLETLADRDWEREWLRDFGPMQFGRRLWVCPADSEPDRSNAVIVRLDPGLAFGTGTHATTAMCLEWLDAIDLQGRTVLDYGCGSGVLAIAALKLGCKQAHAMDIDVQAVTATRENAAQNGVQDRLTVSAPEREIDGQFDVVLANILAGPLVELAGSISDRVRSGGQLALSGILSEQAPEVLEAYAPWVDFDEPEFRQQDGQTWTRLTGRKRHS
ncbi:MAG: 50S ribosomal protein L11 methyltransferase [Gammaproteobacteria bacterium]|jgi:ribosomal protein L11 methyltransferase|nr:50S ribosomal protein L11 methyltransferase [Gammaproteobacteria bacterium]MDH3756476.1 50S ribosomal protein L11 methyltransferase [Gammaproteobacteria bacterium]MDH3848893.1 50S ribosomal protein L11 methyltransferase [Gammaproteobacteria bacterium]MDH3904169.1 50S ribosomal protein L11 methyltransferase [Gammaproteobacteria bacterium]MDH3909039.1 50S ribosomal protein L11 methyltransferase [Gammaproteobacteria bacterium]